MDLSYLAPALLSLSDVVKAANQLANGDKAGIKIFVNADLKQKCFELDLELVLTAWEKAKLLIANKDLATAKHIAEWVGIIGCPTYGLYQLIKHLRGKKIESTTNIKLDNVEIQTTGDSSPIIVANKVFMLYSDTNTRRKAVEVLNPLRNEGYDSLQFYKDDEVFAEFGKDDVPEADGADLPEVTPETSHVSKIRTLARIRKAAYEGTSKWTLVYRSAIEASIEDKEWLERFQSGQAIAPPGSSLDVDLEESYNTNEKGEMLGVATYRIVKVHNVEFALKQTAMFDKEGNDEKS